MQVIKYRQFQTTVQYTDVSISLIDIKINERIGNDIVLVLDSTGIGVTNRGEWLLPPHKWNVRRKGYFKIHVVVVDIKKKKIVSLDVTSEEVVHDGTRLKKLVDNASGSIR
jgi:hypothetical protein